VLIYACGRVVRVPVCLRVAMGDGRWAMGDGRLAGGRGGKGRGRASRRISNFLIMRNVPSFATREPVSRQLEHLRAVMLFRLNVELHFARSPLFIKHFSICV
jgi:hypothetical protein